MKPPLKAYLPPLAYGVSLSILTPLFAMLFGKLSEDRTPYHLALIICAHWCVAAIIAVNVGFQEGRKSIDSKK